MPHTTPVHDLRLSSYSDEVESDHTRRWQCAWPGAFVAGQHDAAASLEWCYSNELQAQAWKTGGASQLYPNDTASDLLLGGGLYSQWDAFVLEDTITPPSAQPNWISDCSAFDDFALQQEDTCVDSQFEDTFPSFACGGGTPMTASSSLSSFSSLNGSVRSAADDNMCLCPYPNCKKAFKRPCELRMHEKTHTKPYYCCECHKQFSNKRDMQRHKRTHERTHQSQQRFRCVAPDCDASFNRKDSWTRHLSTMHFDDKAPVPVG